MSYIKGNFKKYIFRSDNGYVVGLFKVRETDLDLNVKTITFTGFFNELNEMDLYKLEGNLITHSKYGTQFETKSYEIVLPEDKDHIIDFLSSELFKGIGEKKAIKIVDTLGEDCLEKILKDKNVLYDVKTLTTKQIDTIYYTLVDYKSSYEEVMNLIKIGFSMKEALKIQKLYKQNTFEILKNPYQMISDIKEITFMKLEKLRVKLNIERTDINRISEGILYVMDDLSFKFGNTYHSYNDIIYYSKKVLMVDEELISSGIANLIKNNKLLIDDDKYYKIEVYNSEMYIAKRLALLSKSYKPNNFDKCIEEIENDFRCTFNKEQKDAITKALLNKISIITGGPGTGKTTIIKAITSLYQKINKISDLKLIEEVVLLAPTGRASKRMMKETNLPSYTIHRFLKWQKEEDSFIINEENKSDAKFVIVDEASMLDNNLFYNLLLGLKSDCRIVLIGDYNQLPSVGSGQVLKDLIESDMLSVTYLKKLYRQEEASSINLFAHDIINNNIDFSLFNKEDDLTFVECTKDTLKENLKDFIVTYQDMSIYDIQILAPLYKGDNGIDSLNVFVQDILNKKDFSKDETIHDGVLYRNGDKVLHLVNNVDFNVFNGDIGEIIRILKGKSKQIIIDFDGNIVEYTPSNYDNFKLGYTISIHKAQGSEFSVVIIPILNSYGPMLYKKLIYTAVTRAKQKLILLGELSALKKAILTDKDESRKTSLKNFLIECISLKN